jgi:3-deoxy-7-phosphoheptulonate synthase
MSKSDISDLYVAAEEILPTPSQIKTELPLTPGAEKTVRSARRVIRDVLDRKDPRLLLVAGPCSVHDLEGAKEYAQRLSRLADEVSDVFFVLMRVYFSKPRTTVGWKGFINDPFLDDSFRLDEGLFRAREFLIELGEMGVPVATEALDSITPQYLDDVISWNAIGARTAESQAHREMASGLSTPVGIKNGTDGSIGVAINALQTMSQPHHFLGINQDGQCSVLRTTGNPYGHVILRGGGSPNYDSVSIARCEDRLRQAELPVNIVVDCSHGNSLKDFKLQPLVLKDCVNQVVEGNRSIRGLMIESNLFEGRQDVPQCKSDLEYGVSITDACISWETTEEIVRDARQKLLPVIKQVKN